MCLPHVKFNSSSDICRNINCCTGVVVPAEVVLFAVTSAAVIVEPVVIAAVVVSAEVVNSSSSYGRSNISNSTKSNSSNKSISFFVDVIAVVVTLAEKGLGQNVA